MKLVSINVEGNNHDERVLNFLDAEEPDVICAQEAHDAFVEKLEERGYTVASLVQGKRDWNGQVISDITLVASRLPFTHSKYYYYKADDEIPTNVFDPKALRPNLHQGFVLATFTNEEEIHIGSVHFTWTLHGDNPGPAQREDFEAFSELIQTLPPHIMCGDFNIPRYHSPLYDKLTKLYEDNIPRKYESSLDRDLHHLGEDPERQQLFTDYMVDYIFSQSPYKVENVRLEFGISDHAAVIADISKE